MKQESTELSYRGERKGGTEERRERSSDMRTGRLKKKKCKRLTYARSHRK